MFQGFLYLLRAHGLGIGLTEWTCLMDGLELGLHQNSLTEFYYLARAVLIKKESEYDRFDQAFLEYFRGLAQTDTLPFEVSQWLSKTMTQTGLDKDEAEQLWKEKTLEEIKALMEERLKEQKSAHYGGNYWVGTGGTTAFGHSGTAPQGIRLEGRGMGNTAVKTAAERSYRDFREDRVLQVRDFQVALRKLRRLSSKNDGAKTELDVEGTIARTCSRGGLLEVVMERPRKNQTKLLLLMDSGGSMRAYAQMCSRLFQAVHQGNQFKDLKIYYFHNCFYDWLFTGPDCCRENRIETEWIFQNLLPEYKVILVGDATMSPAELLEPGGGQEEMQEEHENEVPGIQWLKRLKKRFPSSIWLNPLHEKLWEYDSSTKTISMIRDIFPMFPLTLRGLEEGIRELKRDPD